MIFRRDPPRPDVMARLQQYNAAPSYRCTRCEVLGRGDRCWCCSSADHLTGAQSLYVGRTVHAS